MPVITQAIDSRDGVFIGGKCLRYKHNTLKTMTTSTTSFFNESIDQELDLDGLSSVTGGGAGLAILGGIAGGLALAGGIAAVGIGIASVGVDVLKGDDIGTAAGDMIDKATK